MSGPGLSLLGGLAERLPRGPWLPLAEGWHYAAWVAIDVRLLLFLALIALLSSVGFCLLFIRRRDPMVTTASFIVAFTIVFGLLVLIFNSIAHYPVFSVQSFFAFP